MARCCDEVRVCGSILMTGAGFAEDLGSEQTEGQRKCFDQNK